MLPRGENSGDWARRMSTLLLSTESQGILECRNVDIAGSAARLESGQQAEDLLVHVWLTASVFQIGESYRALQ